MTSTAERIGTIDWVDLSTPDVEAARAFYAAVLGWTYETTETPMGVYHIARVGGHEAGGLMQSDPDSPTPTAWTMFVKVASVDDMVPAVVNAGGSVVSEPIDIPGGARVAVVADPVGAVFALISGGPEPGADEPTLRRDDPGAVAWCELMSRDPHAAVGFYDATFGWEAAFEPSTGYTTFRVHGVDVGGLLPMPDEMPADAPSAWMVYFGVSDVAAAAQASRSAGGLVVKQPTVVAGMTFAVIADPTGAVFGVLSAPA